MIGFETLHIDTIQSKFLTPNSLMWQCKYVVFDCGQLITTSKIFVNPHLDNNWVYIRIGSIHSTLDSIKHLLPDKIVLFSGNGDWKVIELHKSILDSDLIIKWFAQNGEYNHPKLIPLPIGLESQTIRVTEPIIDSEHSIKDNLVIANYRIHTNEKTRRECLELTGVSLYHSSRPEYLEKLKKTMFSISPEGNGIDCHRTWESLYCKTIPIVTKSNVVSYFSKFFPMIILNHWSEYKTLRLSKELYDEILTKFPNYQDNLLLENYTKNIINSAISNMNKKIISFSLYGTKSIYQFGAEENIKAAEEIYPGWICRFYCTNDVPNLEKLKTLNCELVVLDDKIPPVYWRFFAYDDPSVDVFISRDCDSIVNSREKAAVDEWLKSDKEFHSMHDCKSGHYHDVMAGMFGIKCQKKKFSMRDIVNEFCEKKKYNYSYFDDQYFLIELAKNHFSDNILNHGREIPFPKHEPLKFGHFVGERVGMINYILPSQLESYNKDSSKIFVSFNPTQKVEQLKSYIESKPNGEIVISLLKHLDYIKDEYPDVTFESVNDRSNSVNLFMDKYRNLGFRYVHLPEMTYHSSISRNYKTSLVVPCSQKDFKHIEKLLSHYEQGKVLPDEVVVEMSGINPNLVKSLARQLEHQFSSLNLRILFDTFPLKIAESRQLAADNTDNELIIFSDADDIPHHQRIEVIKHLFQTNDIMHLCHSYIFGYNKLPDINLNTVHRVDSNVLYDYYIKGKDGLEHLRNKLPFGNQFSKDLHTFNQDTHNGVPSILRNVLDRVKWETNPSWNGEDVYFNFRVLKEFNKSMISDSKLYYYQP